MEAKTVSMEDFFILIVSAITLFFAPILGLIVGVAAAIILDTAFGIYRSVMVNGWDSITSRRLSSVISKLLLYELCIILFYVIDFFVLTEFFQKWFSISFFATKMCAILLIFVEVVSIKENFEKATGKDVWKMVSTSVKRVNQLKEGILNIKKVDNDDN